MSHHINLIRKCLYNNKRWKLNNIQYQFRVGFVTRADSNIKRGGNMSEKLDKIKTNFLKKIDGIFEEVKKEIEDVLSKSETKHVHAELMQLYEKDKKLTDEPWKLWELNRGAGWLDINYGDPCWSESIQYRRKPQFITINGFEVPEPERNPLENGDRYHSPEMREELLVSTYTWRDDDIDECLLKNGLVHLPKEAANIHARAIISFTKSSK